MVIANIFPTDLPRGTAMTPNPRPVLLSSTTAVGEMIIDSVVDSHAKLLVEVSNQQNHVSAHNILEGNIEALMNCDGPFSVICAAWPDWGPCNRLRWMWHFNITTGRCEQFLWGGCEGNLNRFTNFDQCQTTCEIPTGSKSM